MEPNDTNKRPVCLGPCGLPKPLSSYYLTKKGKRAYGLCKECHRAKQRKYRDDNLEQETKKNQEYHRANRESLLPKMRRRAKEVKFAVLQVYSSTIPECACCGETTLAFLAIDHEHGGGSRERRAGIRGNSMYRQLANEGFPDGFRVLCHNCNLGRNIINGRNQNDGLCPHELRRLGRQEVP